MSEIISGVPVLPPGVVDMLIGNREAGNLLFTSPDVPVISFTGSTVTGRTISANAAQHLKRLGLELGGKTPTREELLPFNIQPVSQIPLVACHSTRLNTECLCPAFPLAPLFAA
jgi:hypothetical protein